MDKSSKLVRVPPVPLSLKVGPCKATVRWVRRVSKFKIRMIVCRAWRFWNRIWSWRRWFYNAIGRNCINGVFWALYSDGLWVDGHNGEKTICNESQFRWLVDQCNCKVDKISTRYIIVCTAKTSINVSFALRLSILKLLSGKFHWCCQLMFPSQVPLSRRVVTHDSFVSSVLMLVPDVSTEARRWRRQYCYAADYYKHT